MNEGSSCYHEACHAVMLWHYGVRIRYVTEAARDSGHCGQAVPGDRPEIDDPADLKIGTRVAAAAEIAATRVFTTKNVPWTIS